MIKEHVDDKLFDKESFITSSNSSRKTINREVQNDDEDPKTYTDQNISPIPIEEDLIA